MSIAACTRRQKIFYAFQRPGRTGLTWYSGLVIDDRIYVIDYIYKLLRCAEYVLHTNVNLN